MGNLTDPPSSGREDIPLALALSRGVVSTRTHNALLAAGFRSLPEVLAAQDDELLRIRNLGRKSLAEIAHARALTHLGENTRESDLSDPLRYRVESGRVTQRLPGDGLPPFEQGVWEDLSLSEAFTRGLISTRTRNALMAAGFRRLPPVLAKSDESLLAIRNFGRKCLVEIDTARVATLTQTPTTRPSRANPQALSAICSRYVYPLSRVAGTDASKWTWLDVLRVAGDDDTDWGHRFGLGEPQRQVSRIVESLCSDILEEDATKDALVFTEGSVHLAVRLRLVSPSTYRRLRVLGLDRDFLFLSQFDAHRHTAAILGAQGAHEVRSLIQMADTTALDRNPHPPDDKVALEGEVAKKSGSDDNSGLTRLLSSVSQSEMDLIRGRIRGRTLQELGAQRTVTRERIRQILDRAEDTIKRHVVQGDLRTAWEHLAQRLVCSEVDLAQPFVGHHEMDSESMSMAFVAAWPFFQEVRLPSGARLEGWWTADPERIRATIQDLRQSPGPLDDLQLTAWAHQAGFPAGMPWQDLLVGPTCPLRFDQRVQAWVRRTASTRDAAYMRLLRTGEPILLSTLATALNSPPRNLEAQLARDHRFTRDTYSGRWGLSEWDLPQRPYRTTLEAVLDVISQYGPISRPDLVRRATALHPVSAGAVYQCFADSRIGTTDEGMIDLISRGARHEDESDPRKPPSILVDMNGTVLVWNTTVTKDVLRGSGMPTHRYLPWAMGLRTLPSERTFSTPFAHDVRVSRGIHGASVSSLRWFAYMYELNVGCSIAVRFDLNSDKADIIPSCSHHHRPVRGPRRRLE